MKLRVIRKKIALKVIFIVGLTMIVVVGPYLYWAIDKLEKEHINEVIRGGIRLSDSLKNCFRYAMLRDDKIAVRKAVAMVGTLEEIEALRIYNKDGVVAISSNLREVNKTVDMSAAACSPCHQFKTPPKQLSDFERVNIYKAADSHRTLMLINPIYNGPDCYNAACHVHPDDQRILGVMDLSLSLKVHDDNARQKRNQLIVFITGLLGAVSLTIALAIHRIVARPIEKLLKGTRTIASGNLDYLLEKASDDEIGILAESFNTMTRNLKEMRNQLLQSERLASLGRMAAGIAHEINNPLTGIMMFASMLQDEFPSTDPRYDNLKVIIDETKRCREIIKGLLDFSRQRQPNRKITDLKTVFQNTIRIISSQLQASGVSIDLNIDPAIPPCLLDEVQIQQLLLNLLINAVDAMPEGGKITVDAKLADGDIVIRVSDTGTGIAKEDLPHIFEPFFTKKGVKGTGLGLAVSWGIVQQHGGSIQVESEVKKGTTFRIVLPVEQGKKEH